MIILYSAGMFKIQNRCKLACLLTGYKFILCDIQDDPGIHSRSFQTTIVHRMTSSHMYGQTKNEGSV
jgi:hypothetical protein